MLCYSSIARLFKKILAWAHWSTLEHILKKLGLCDMSQLAQWFSKKENALANNLLIDTFKKIFDATRWDWLLLEQKKT